jgi:menaquinone-dependent protoporphyrinogen oxidase
LTGFSGGNMQDNPDSANSISHRSFLKAGCLGMAAVGVATCGISAAVPRQTPVHLQSFTFGENTMSNRILIAYASANRSTIEVAAAIGEALNQHGCAVDVRPIQDNPSIVGYQAVLIGSAVQYGSWLPTAIEFVRANQQSLLQIPVALFCVHIQNLGDDETSRRNRLAYLDPVRDLIDPVQEGYFAGKFDRRGAALLLPGLVARFVPTIDLRNWAKIRTWAEGLPPLLLQPSRVRCVPGPTHYAGLSQL